MSNTINLRVVDLVGPLCVSADDGQSVHNAIASALAEGNSVVLSFEGVSTIISAFLNASIGQLYGEFEETEIRKNLAVANMGADDLALLKRVVENAKLYFNNRKAFDTVWEEVSDDEE